MGFHDSSLGTGTPATSPADAKNVLNAPAPVAMSVEQAQAYSGFSRKHLDHLIRTGKLNRARLGPKGAYIVRRDQLDAAIADAFAHQADSLERDFRFV